MKTVDGLNRLVICHSWWSLLHWSICIQSVHFCPQGVFFHQNSTWLLQMYILLLPLIGSQSTLIRSPIKTVAGTPGRRVEDRLPSSSAGFSYPSSGFFLYLFFHRNQTELLEEIIEIFVLLVFLFQFNINSRTVLDNMRRTEVSWNISRYSLFFPSPAVFFANFLSSPFQGVAWRASWAELHRGLLLFSRQNKSNLSPLSAEKSNTFSFIFLWNLLKVRPAGLTNGSKTESEIQVMTRQIKNRNLIFLDLLHTVVLV